MVLFINDVLVGFIRHILDQVNQFYRDQGINVVGFYPA